MDQEVWHLVEGRRDDGAPAMFRIRELAPRLDLPRIFVVEMPYPLSEISRLPDAGGYRRLAAFEEQWVGPACAATGYEPVGLKIEEGAFFLYMYGAADPNELIARLAPFDAALGFYDDEDPTWAEYATLKDLLDQAKAMPLDAAMDAEPRGRAATIGPATRAAVRAAARAAVDKPAGAKAASASAAKAPTSAKRTTKLTKPKAKTSAAKASAAKTAAAKKRPAAGTSAAKRSAPKRAPNRTSARSTKTSGRAKKSSKRR